MWHVWESLHTGVCQVNLKVIEHFQDLGVDGRVIIKIYFKIRLKTWTGLNLPEERD
jgi:hypothetical protein